jgi:hypothetical protein
MKHGLAGFTLTAACSPPQALSIVEARPTPEPSPTG